MSTPLPGQKIVATDKNPQYPEGHVFGVVKTVTGNRVEFDTEYGFAGFDWNAPDGINPWVKFE